MVLFYNVKCFCLRGGIEHRNLRLSQLKRFSNPDLYMYKEYASKNRLGGVVQLKMNHKSVTIVANPAAGHHCHIFLLDKYISKLPLDAVKKDLFTAVLLMNRSNVKVSKILTGEASNFGYVILIKIK